MYKTVILIDLMYTNLKSNKVSLSLKFDCTENLRIQL